MQVVYTYKTANYSGTIEFEGDWEDLNESHFLDMVLEDLYNGGAEGAEAEEEVQSIDFQLMAKGIQ